MKPRIARRDGMAWSEVRHADQSTDGGHYAQQHQRGGGKPFLPFRLHVGTGEERMSSWTPMAKSVHERCDSHSAALRFFTSRSPATMLTSFRIARLEHESVLRDICIELRCVGLPRHEADIAIGPQQEQRIASEAGSFMRIFPVEPV